MRYTIVCESKMERDMTAISLVTVGQAEEDKQGVYGRSHAYNPAHSTYCDFSVPKSGQKEFIYFLLLF